MAPIVDKKAESDENIPKMLCQMDNHEGSINGYYILMCSSWDKSNLWNFCLLILFAACVNCVRWSHSGRFLASGGDDKLIMVWKINQYSGKCTHSLVTLIQVILT